MIEFSTKKIIFFDLDGTLSESKHSLADNMALLICELLYKYDVAVVSGASFDQFKLQFISKIPCHDLFYKLHIFPTNGASYYAYNLETRLWHEEYKKLISKINVERIKIAIEKAIQFAEIEIPEKLYGEQIENRGSQVTISLLGQNAPLSEKSKFDKDQEKRKRIRSELLELLPDFNIVIGGMTSIDITEKGIDKAFAIENLMKKLKLNKKDVLYVGDAIFPGGNDYAAVTEGVDTLKVLNPKDTLHKMQNYI